MFASAIIVFRETLEAAIIIGILCASTKNIINSRKWISLGIIAGVIASFIIAAFMGVISTLAEGNGQEIMKIIAVSVAIIMLSWHQIIMSTHGKNIALEAKNIGEQVKNGNKTIAAVAFAIFLTVFREGSETVLFLQGAFISQENSILDIVSGMMLGLVSGSLIGYIIYTGLLKISLQKVFKFTNILLLLLVAGMASNLALLCIQIDWLPVIYAPIWDTNWLLSDSSVIGQTLNIMMGYTAQPNAMQLIFYIVTIGIILTLDKFRQSAIR